MKVVRSLNLMLLTVAVIGASALAQPRRIEFRFHRGHQRDVRLASTSLTSYLYVFEAQLAQIEKRFPVLFKINDEFLKLKAANAELFKQTLPEKFSDGKNIFTEYAKVKDASEVFQREFARAFQLLELKEDEHRDEAVNYLQAAYLDLAKALANLALEMPHTHFGR